jgi:hypothetical protein
MKWTRTTAELSLRRDRESTEYREALAQVLEESSKNGGPDRRPYDPGTIDSGAESMSYATVDIASIGVNFAHNERSRFPLPQQRLIRGFSSCPAKNACNGDFNRCSNPS